MSAADRRAPAVRRSVAAGQERITASGIRLARQPSTMIHGLGYAPLARGRARMALNTYLTFDGNCREAFEFYRSVFGGEFAEFRTFGDGPPDMPVSEAEKNAPLARGRARMALNTYLTFDGNCREAFEFYRSVFGGEFAEFGRSATDRPMPVSEAEKNHVLHVALPIGSSVLMGSDSSSSPRSRSATISPCPSRWRAGSSATSCSRSCPRAVRWSCRSRRCSGAPTSGSVPTGSASTGWSTTRCPPSERAGGSHGLHRPGASGRTTQAVSMPAAPSSSSSAVAISRIRNFWTLPVTVMGNASTSFQ